MKPDNKIITLTPGEARELAGRYYDALTTEAEEQALKRFVCSPAGAGADFDELRALMGLAAYGRRMKQQTSAATPKAAETLTLLQSRRRTAMIRWAAAAVFVIAAGVSTATLVYNHNNQCVAYIDGHKVTDTRQVMAAMHSSMRSVGAPTGTPSVEAQLTDMFKTID